MLSLQIAVALLLLGAILALLGSAWVSLTTTERLDVTGIGFVVIILLLGLDTIRNRR